MTLTNGTPPSDLRGAAAYHLARGRLPIPVHYRTKKAVGEEWQKQRPTPEDLPWLFPEGGQLNLGLLLGEPSDGLVDIDLDCAQAIAAAPFLLPPTPMIHGRASAPQSHWWYTTDAPPAKASSAFTDVGGKKLLELRSTGGQTVIPPSVHEEGEPLQWHSCGEPAFVPLADLRPAVCAVAAAAIFARHWPEKGTRHDLILALCGGLLRAGWAIERVETFLRAVLAATDTRDGEKELRSAADTKEKLDAGENVWGWPKVAELLVNGGEEVVKRMRGWLGVTAAARVGDLPTPEPLPWPDPPAAEAFHGLAGKIVRTIEPASEADPAALLVQTLVAFGNVIGRGAHFLVEADRHHANEFAVLVGRTSKARKGTSWGRVSRLFREAEEQWAQERVQSGLSSGEGLIWSVRDPIKKRERVKEKGEAARYEEVEADPGIDDKRLLILEPEFANVLKQTERQGNTLSVLLRLAWDGLDLRSLTKNSPARATGAHVSEIGHITADELRRYLTQTEMANGLGNRHLWVCSDRSKLLPEGGHIDAATWGGLRDELAQALAFARGAGEMTRDKEAKVIWRDVYGLLSEGKPGLAGALLARAEAHVLRLAMIYALMDRSEVIRADHLMAALALWDYCERSVYFVFGDSLGDPVADELLRLLRTCPDGMTRNDLRDYFGRNQSSDRIGRALGLLLQHRLARCERQETGGRPAERWFASAKARGG
jgi:hypothetical protein